MHIEIGDKVVIRENLVYGPVNVGYTQVLVTEDMAKYAGETATILRERAQGVYEIDLDNKTWAWHKFMFKEKVNNIKGQVNPIYKVVYVKPTFIDDNVAKVMKSGKCVIVILDTGEKGVAKCSPNDNFDLELGYSIAHSRALVKKYKNDINDEMKIIKYLTE